MDIKEKLMRALGIAKIGKLYTVTHDEKKYLMFERVIYGKATTPFIDREYRIVGLENSPVGDSKEILFWFNADKQFKDLDGIVLIDTVCHSLLYIEKNGYTHLGGVL